MPPPVALASVRLKPHGSHRRWYAAAAAVFVVALGVAAIAWPRNANAPDLVTTETAAATPPTLDTATVAITQPSQPTTSISSEPSTSISPTPTTTTTATSTSTTTATTATITTTTTAAIPVVGAPCEAEPFTPPSLVDGTPPGDPVIEQLEGGRIVRWGDVDSPFGVSQSLGFPIDESWLDNAIENERAITAGNWQTTTVAVGDPPLSGITIYLRDTTDGCLRTYNVGPGLYSDQADTLAGDWITALSTGQPMEPVGHIDIGVAYFGRRITPFDTPFFEIDEFDATGITGSTFDAEQVAALFPRQTLSDGSTIELISSPNVSRCTNRPLIASEGTAPTSALAALDSARSIAITPTGTLLATRDVCPPGTRWGDPGTLNELIELDPAADNPSTVTRRTWPSDPDQIVLDDGVRVIATGEQTLGDISPGGRYISLREQLGSDAARWSVIDLDNDATTRPPASTCENASDLVGPPHFVSADVVVVARTCAAGNDADEVHIEAVDLSAQNASDSTVWSRSVPGVGVDEFTQTVDLSAVELDDGTIWAIVAGNGGLDVSSQSYAINADDTVEITRLGYQNFAFQPADLINTFDTPPT